MSIESFLAEFYPKPAKRAINTIVEAADHSYQKWLGRLPENLEKHDCHIHYSAVNAGDPDEVTPVLYYGEGSCSLCQWSYRNDHSHLDHCEICPITQLIGHTCDDDNIPEKRSIYVKAVHGNTSIEMIELLHKVRMFVRLNELTHTASWCSSPIME